MMHAGCDLYRDFMCVLKISEWGKSHTHAYTRGQGSARKGYEGEGHLQIHWRKKKVSTTNVNKKVCSYRTMYLKSLFILLCILGIRLLFTTSCTRLWTIWHLSDAPFSLAHTQSKFLTSPCNLAGGF